LRIVGISVLKSAVGAEASKRSQCLIDRKEASFESSRERLSVEMRHDQEVGTVDRADVVDGANVRMLERGHGTRFPLETCAQIGIVGDCFGKDFDRDRSVEARVAGFVDLAHPARAKGRENLIRAESSNGQ
jgi:hypothetical protein